MGDLNFSLKDGDKLPIITIKGIKLKDIQRKGMELDGVIKFDWTSPFYALDINLVDITMKTNDFILTNATDINEAILDITCEKCTDKIKALLRLEKE